MANDNGYLIFCFRIFFANRFGSVRRNGSGISTVA